MEGDIDANASLDYVLFHFFQSENRFEASICSEGRTEKISSGCLDQLLLHVPAVVLLNGDLRDPYKLQPVKGLSDSSWFNKSAVRAFLNLLNEPEELKKINAIQNELSQLEDTRGFHVALYTKDKQAHIGESSADIGFLKEVESMQRVKVETVSSDTTKNELLRALDLRLMALKEEFDDTLDQLLGLESKGQISDLVAFVRHFGRDDLRNMLLKYLEWKFDCSDTLNEQTESLINSNSHTGNKSEDKSLAPRAGFLSAVGNSISPANITQGLQKSPTESEDSSNSSDGEQISAERSRPVIRSASPRRSASPMRRVQIGRSGSRRATALTIKSLSYFPARERTFVSKEGDENGQEDESSEQQTKRSENTTMRMSVQDRINLFESKQRDQTLDIQKKNSSTELPFGSKKSVLRRWSSSPGNSTVQCQEVSSDATCNSPCSLVLEPENKSSLEKPDIPVVTIKSDDKSDAPFHSKANVMLVGSVGNPPDLVASESDEVHARAAASAEWTRKKEAELNQLMMMMDIKSAKFGPLTHGGEDQDAEQKSNFYSQYKEKRTEKLRTLNAGRKSEKEAKFKAMADAMEKRGVELVKKVGMTEKVNPHPQKLRRNSSPPVLSNKGASNIVGSKKSSPQPPSPSLVKRNSLPLTSSPKPSGTVTHKISSKTIASSPNQRRSHPATSQTPPNPHSEMPRQTKGVKPAKPMANEMKPDMKSLEKKPRAVTRGAKTPKAKSSTPTVDDSVLISSKPSFYNKVTRKSSVVPLEQKPFLKKGTGIGSGSGRAKTKPPQSDECIKNSETLQVDVKEPEACMPDTPAQPEVLDTMVETNDDNFIGEDDPSNTEVNPDKEDEIDAPVALAYDSMIQLAESPVPEIQQEQEMVISSAAWVDADHQVIHQFSKDCQCQMTVPGDVIPATLTSPRVRHSLSQMLQADNTESDIIEWGNAENPPSLVYQKDAPKGFKRLLKFARKNKGEPNLTGWSSPSTFSDGEDDTVESKTINNKRAGAPSRKAIAKGKISGKSRNLYESFDGGNKRSHDHPAKHDILSASMSSLPLDLHMLQEGSIPSVTSSSKGSRSFFSLSTFRSNKSSDSKLH